IKPTSGLVRFDGVDITANLEVKKIRRRMQIIFQDPYASLDPRKTVLSALTVEPEFIILDEPTSFLDVLVQAQILGLLKDLQRELQLTYVFVSHNLSVVQHMSDRVGVMYLGKIIEEASRDTLYKS